MLTRRKFLAATTALVPAILCAPLLAQDDYHVLLGPAGSWQVGRVVETVNRSGDVAEFHYSFQRWNGELAFDLAQYGNVVQDWMLT